MGELIKNGRYMAVLEVASILGHQPRYLHWDKLRRHAPPAGLNHREWWFITKMARSNFLRKLPLIDKKGADFAFCVPDIIQEDLHQIDSGARGRVDMPSSSITNPQFRNSYIVSSLMEEAITSSQLEGAITTREVAKDMIRGGRKPRDNSERMILNNYITMQRIRELKDAPLTPDLVFQIHKLVTHQTLEDATAAGRFRREEEWRVVGDDEGEIFHDPPPADELPARLEIMCAFANGILPDHFIHPVVRAIILHFWLAYDHPFVDGNGRTARALFYWAMLRHGYWLFEFISISSILREAPVKYYRSFLHTETDGNDLTYFLVAQTEVIRSAIASLHRYIERKTAETRDVETRLRALDQFNHRQTALMKHALKHPGFRYTIAGHQESHQTSYQTARTDLLDLSHHGLLEHRKKGREFTFNSPPDLAERLRKMENT